ncbi:MAG: hypothetical protein J6T10_03365 [Methanobrevibacter sp.]|nr:hypothetical protein [Methanobrevibacter sp.]
MKKNRIRVREIILEYVKKYEDSSWLSCNIQEMVNKTDKFVFGVIHAKTNNLTFLPNLYNFLNLTINGKNVYKYLDFQFLSCGWDRFISPVWERLATQINGVHIDDYSRYNEQLAVNVLSKFGDKWDRLIDSFFKDYNPIHNYDMEETKDTNTLMTIGDTNENYVSGFNSSTMVKNSENPNTRTITGDKKDNVEHTTRAGNIGVTTSQQMLQSEIELRQYNIIDQMLNDVYSLLTLSIY